MEVDGNVDPRRWTPLTFLFPGRFVDRDDRWADFDLLEWSDGEYDWTQDAWNGFRDFAQRPAETVETGRGDCEDYALVALSWAVAADRDGIGLGFCWESGTPWPTHVIAFDEERVYSSGNTPETGVDEWIEDSDYTFALRRRVR
jgi:hypothetical protein